MNKQILVSALHFLVVLCRHFDQDFETVRP